MARVNFTGAGKLKHSIIVGLGKTGISCVQYFIRKKKNIIVLDTRANPPGLAEFKREFPQIPVYLEKLDPKLLDQADEVIVSPGVSLEEPFLQQAIQKKIPVIGDIELFVRAAKAPIVAITGTNAKGTVTTLIGDMIKNAGYKVIVGGNIGTPALDLLVEAKPDFYVLELSSFQLESTFSLQAEAATILNISEDHLDRHKTMEAYIAAKQRIYLNCKNAIWNREDKWTYPAYRSQEKEMAKYLSFGLSEPGVGEFGLHQQNLAFGEQVLLPVNQLLIKGKHNWANALAALALGYAIGLPFEPMLTALTRFKGLHHRCEWLAEADGISWYNDSKGTNIGATIAAIEGLGGSISGKLVLIAGGIGKGADFSVLKDPVAKYVKNVILIGKDAPIIEQALNDVVPIHHADSLKSAVLLAKELAKKKDVVLLSPACASFDMFQNYEHRGEVFKEVVREIL